MDTPLYSQDVGLGTLGQSEFLQDLAVQIAAVSTDVARLRQPGSVVVKLKISPAPGTATGVVVIEEIEPHHPKELSKGAQVFVVDGKLYHEDPTRPRLPHIGVDRQMRVEEVARPALQVEEVS